MLRKHLICTYYRYYSLVQKRLCILVRVFERAPISVIGLDTQTCPVETLLLVRKTQINDLVPSRKLAPPYQAHEKQFARSDEHLSFNDVEPFDTNV